MMKGCLRLLPLVLLVLPVAAEGQKRDETSKRALEKYEAGRTAYRLAEYDRAIEEWKEGYRIKPDPVFLYNIAQAYRETGDQERALSFYKNYLREAEDPPNREEVEERIEELERLIAENKAAREKPPQDPLSPVEPAQPDPSASSPPESGAAGIARDSHPSSRSGSGGGSLKMAGMVSGAAGAALLATGVIFGLGARAAERDVERAVENNDAWSETLQGRLDTGKRRATLANVSLGLGAAAALGGAVLYALGMRQDSVEVSAAYSPEGFGALVRVRY